MRTRIQELVAHVVCMNVRLWAATTAVGTSMALGGNVGPVTYYVDQAIIDTHVASSMPDFTTYSPVTFAVNTGTSPVFKTVADINRLRPSAGDTVLFRRGQAWREQLTVSTDGSQGSPITYGAFGDGAAPVISGADVLSAWTDNTPSGAASTWYAEVATEPMIVLFNGAIGTKVASVSACNGEKKWYWASNRLYTYGGVDPNTTYPGQIEGGQREYAIRVSGKSYVTIAGLHATKANKVGISFDAYGADGMGVNIIGNLLDYNAEGGMWAIAYAGHTISNLLVSRNEAALNGAFGMRGNAPDAGSALTHSTWSHNRTHHNCWSSQIDYAGMKWFGRHVTDQTIEYNESYRNGEGRTYAGNTGWGIYVDTVGPGNVIRYNKVHDNHFDGFNIEKSTGVKLYYNVSYGQATGAGIQVDTDVHRNEIYNNVCYGNRDGIWITSWEPAAAGVTDNVVKNNILAGNTSRALRALNGGENDGLNGSGNVYVYNALGSETEDFIEWGSGVCRSTYAAWETAYGGTSHSVRAPPEFTSGSDFHPTATSPVIDAGVKVGLTVDCDGHSIQGLPDVGAYEYVTSRPSGRSARPQ